MVFVPDGIRLPAGVLYQARRGCIRLQKEWVNRGELCEYDFKETLVKVDLYHSFGAIE